MRLNSASSLSIVVLPNRIGLVLRTMSCITVVKQVFYQYSVVSSVNGGCSRSMVISS